MASAKIGATTGVSIVTVAFLTLHQLYISAYDVSLLCIHPSCNANGHHTRRLVQLELHDNADGVTFVTSHLHEGRWQPTTHANTLYPSAKTPGVTCTHKLSFGLYFTSIIAKVAGRYRIPYSLTSKKWDLRKAIFHGALYLSVLYGAPTW